MGFFGGLGKIAKGIGRVAAPVLGGALGGPLGAAAGNAIGSKFFGGDDGGLSLPGVGGPVQIPGLPSLGGGGQETLNAILSGLDFQRRNEQLGDLQGRSEQDFQARLPLQEAFLQSFINQNSLQAPDLASTFATENPFSRPAGPVSFGGQGPAIQPPSPFGPETFDAGFTGPSGGGDVGRDQLLRGSTLALGPGPGLPQPFAPQPRAPTGLRRRADERNQVLF